MTTTPTIAELEKRMRPGAFSAGGFLGVTESLEAVIDQDHQALEALGISYQQIADELARILRAVENQRDRVSRENRAEYLHRERYDASPYFSTCAQSSIPSDLPDVDVGYLVDGKFQIFISDTKGFQECPWGCEYDRWSSFDFALVNRRLGEHNTAPGLIIHLIREHHFFEGMESPYRVDPARLIRLLELSSRNA